MAYWAKNHVAVLTRVAHQMTYLDLSKPNLAEANILKAFES